MNATVIIDGKLMAESLLGKLRAEVAELKKGYDIVPGLGVILVGCDPASRIYIANKVKRAHEVGINIFQHMLDQDVDENELISIIDSLNLNIAVHGILVQLPLPEHIHQHTVINSIDYMKDVDGFTVMNVGLLNTWQPCLKPSTPQGVLLILKDIFGPDLSGKKAVVLGRSLVVGRPMADILVRENCTVTVLHSHSCDVKEECRTADILISAIGKPGFVTSAFVKPGACVIDVGITRIGDRIVGDVKSEDVMGVAGYLTPVPGGVGPMTVACMLLNTVKACKNQCVSRRNP